MLHETDDAGQGEEQLVLSSSDPDANGTLDEVVADPVRLQRWILLIYRIPAEPSSARTAIWRETKRLGAVSLQHAVCLFPLTERLQMSCTRLARRITEGYGGEATLLQTISPDATWQARIIERFNAARDEEYEEVIDETERFHEEIARERRKGKYTFAELEDEESNLRSHLRWNLQELRIEILDIDHAMGHDRIGGEETIALHATTSNLRTRRPGMFVFLVIWASCYESHTPLTSGVTVHYSIHIE